MRPVSKILLTVLAGVALATVVVGLLRLRQARALETQVAALERREQQAVARVAVLETRLEAESRRVAGTEEDNKALTTAIEKTRSALAAKTISARSSAPEKLSNAEIQARYERGKQLARDGDPAEALQELLWCFDDGMVGVAAYGGVRTSYLLDDIKRLGARYPAALAALVERRDRARKRIVAGADREIPDLVTLNRLLGEEEHTLELYDQIPLGDRRRITFAIYASDLLLEQRRYADIAAAKSFALESGNFESHVNEDRVPANVANAEQLRANERRYIVDTFGKSIEVFAGAGELDHARNLAQRLLKYDDTEATRAAIQQHLDRAGQPKLLAAP